MASRKEKQEDFVKRAKLIKGNECIDYSQVEYINNRTPVKLIDHSLRPDGTEYGEFWQTPGNHLKGQGHPDKRGAKIAKGKSSKQEEVIKRFKEVHKGENLDYSKVEYVNMHTKVCIISHDLRPDGTEYGEFWQEPVVHLKGCSHPELGIKKMQASQSLSQEQCIEKLKIAFINKPYYSLEHVVYTSYRGKVAINCHRIGADDKEHGIFYMSFENLIAGKGCPKCGNHLSYAEEEINDFIKQYVDTIQHDHKVLKGKELDIYIPSLKIAIEYNGLYWHSEKQGKDRSYHLNKLQECNKQGIKLMQIFEDEYQDKREIVYNKIKHIIGFDTDKLKIYGRKCTIREITKDDARLFLDKNHIQGFVSATVYLGAFYNNELIGVMDFNKMPDGLWDLNRFASNIKYNCIGVGGKLFKHFIRNYDFTEIKSFADRRWTLNEENNLYLQLGFKFDSYVVPSYTYYRKEDGIIRHHKFGFRKQKLNKKYGLPLSMTEREMTEALGYDRIYDCGLIKYVYTKKENDNG